MRQHTKSLCNLSKFTRAFCVMYRNEGLEEEGGGVLDAGEVETLGGGGVTGEAAVMTGDEVGESGGGEFAITDVEERTDDGTHHIAQKTVGGNDKNGFVVVLDEPFGAGEVADFGFDIGMRAAERGEVLFTEEVLRRNVHRLIVQARTHLCPESGLERVFAGGDAVAVGAGEGIKACVGGVYDRENIVHGDVGGQKAVETIDEVLRIENGGYGIEMRIHHFGMYPRIGTTGESKRNGATEERRHSGFHSILHRAARGLRLRAVETGTKISETNEISHFYFYRNINYHELTINSVTNNVWRLLNSLS